MNLLSSRLSNLGRKRTEEVDLSMNSMNDSSSNLNQEWKVQDGPIKRKFSTLKLWSGYSLAGISVICAFLAMLYMPVMLVVPSKFCLLFSMALAGASGATICLYGWSTLREVLFTGRERFYAYTLIASNILGLIVSFADFSTLLCLALILTQFFALSYVALTRVPYGKEFLDSFYRGLMNCTRALGRKLVRRG